MKRVVIVGGGYGGVRAMQRLSSLGLRVTLIDQKPYHYLQTEAYALIAHRASLVDISVDLITLCKSYENVEFVNRKVFDVDFESKRVICTDESYEYDYLILAMGSRTLFPKSVKGLREHSQGVKSLFHAFAFRQKFEHELFMRMRSDSDSACRTFSVVVAGAGLSGVEIAAEMASSIREFMHKNRMVCDTIDIHLVSAGASVLEGLDEYLVQKAMDRLKKLKVKVSLNSLVTRVEPRCAHLSSGEKIGFDFMIFAGGIRAAGLVEKLQLETNRAGQIITDSTLKVKNCDDVFAIGDVAQLLDEHNTPVPATANAAEKSAEAVVKNIALDLSGEKMLDVDIKLEGVMVALGKNSAAVVLFDKIKFSGLLGYWLKKAIIFRYKYLLDADALRAYRRIKQTQKRGSNENH